ncbi:MAG: hydrogenase 4 subunit B [Clostridia bacterium]|nr:hydrogenase 4 subunit B [Clostridia bacterium]
MDIIHAEFLISSAFIVYIGAALLSLLFYKKHRLCNILSNFLGCAASLLGIGGSLIHLFSKNDSLSILDTVSLTPYLCLDIQLDKLSAFFVLTLSVLVFCVSLYSIGYLSHYYGKRNVGLFHFLYNTFILSMALVITSGNMIFFLVAWELMSLTSYFLVVFESENAEARKSGNFYLVMTHAATAFLIIAFVLIYTWTGSLDMETAVHNLSIPLKNILFLCFVIGFGTKAGMIPLHIWLPAAHPAAPSNVSALMSGFMIKTAIYGFIRFVMDMLGAESTWWGISLLSIGALTAVLGVAYALMEQNLKRLLAYSSIENIGIILMGLGLSSWALASKNPALASLAMLGTLLHLFNHSLFKGLLFLGAGAVHYSTHTKNMEQLGGLIKRMPYTAFFFLIGSLSICALPPFNGFIGEWITYQALFINLGLSPSGLKIIVLLAVAALAMAGAFALACFVKAFGISFLALPRSIEAETAKEVPLPMVLGMGLLSLLCIVLGIFPSLLTGLIDKVSMSILGSTAALKGSSSFLYYHVSIEGNSVSPLFILMGGILIIAFVFVFVKFLGKGVKERKYGTWDCGFTALNSRMQYSSTGFSKPIRIVFRALFRPTRDLHLEEGPSPYYPKTLKYQVSTEPIFEKYLYRPVIDKFFNFAKKLRLTIQTGSVHIYLTYIFVTIVLLFIYYSFS